jgi:hypothetical protein
MSRLLWRPDKVASTPVSESADGGWPALQHCRLRRFLDAWDSHLESELRR